jgi:hypothetical protein
MDRDQARALASLTTGIYVMTGSTLQTGNYGK